jgi:uncharacterized protein
MAAKGEQIPVIDMFSGVQLDLALGRSNVIHAALVTGPESATFLARSLRLARFRTGISGGAADSQSAAQLNTPREIPQGSRPV